MHIHGYGNTMHVHVCMITGVSGIRTKTDTSIVG